MNSFRNVLGLKEEKFKEKVKDPGDIAEMGWMDILSNFKRLVNAKRVNVQIKNLAKAWQPLISDLEKMVKQIQTKHTELMVPEVPGQSEPSDPIKQFLAITDKMITKAKILMASVNYDLYFVPDEQAAKAIKAENAVIVYKNLNGHYCARVLAKKSHSIKKDVDVTVTVTKVPAKLVEKCAALQKNEKNEVLITEESLDLVDELTTVLAGAAHKNKLEKTKKKLLSGALQLADEIPVFLDAFAKLPLVPIITDRLSKFKTEVEEFDFGGMLKAVLPIDMYKHLRKKAFDALKPDEFKLLSRDKQAAALALMESYNTAIKFAILAMDKVEIENGLVAGALSTKIGIIDNKSLKELCEEFNKVYITAMATAKFPVQTELYPYAFSILEQRKAMLAALPAKDKENTAKWAIQKNRLQERIEALGEVKELPKREDTQDFYKFMQRTLKENYKRLEELKNQLAPQAQASVSDIKGDDAKPVDLTREARSVIAKAEIELKRVLDEDIFQTYFMKQTVANKQSPWIHQVANAFHNVKKMIAKIELLQEVHPEILASDTPFNHLEHRVTEVSELAAAGAELLIALNQIKGNAHLKKLISMPVLEGVALGKEWQEQAEIAASQAKSVASDIKQSGTPLTDVIKIVQGKIEVKMKTVGTELQEETITALREVTGLAKSLELLYQRLDKDAKEQPNLVEFALTHFTQIIGIVSSLPKILATLNKLAKNDAMLMATQINSALKEMVLLADKLEIQFCLKEGYLANKLRPMMLSYYKEVNRLGYDFMPDEHYPFTVAIAGQRKKLLQDADTPVFQANLIGDRIERRTHFEQARQSLQEKFAGPSNEKQEKINKEMNDFLIKHIEKLRWLEVREKLGKDMNAAGEFGTKIKLLDRFREIVNSMEPTQAVDVEKILQQLRNESPKDVHWLYEGNTGKILKQLEYKTVSPDDLFKALDIELAQLKQQRGTTHYIYSMHKAKLLEERINACEKLQNLMKNHNLSDALAGLEFNEKSLLEKYDPVFLGKLKLMEQAIPVEHRTKTIIGAVAAKNDPVQVVPIAAVENSAEQKYAIQLINDRLTELESTRLGSAISSLKSKLKSATSLSLVDIRQQKIAVLTALKTQLSQPGVSLTVAINKIKAGEKTKDTAYLLFEGRTGKTIKAAQNMTITRVELVHRIDAEINDLKRQRYTPLRVFAQSRKVTGDEQMEALQKLRAAIMQDSSKSVREIINSLGPEEKKVLQRYDADLLKDFKVFEQAVTKQSSTGR